MNQFVATRGTGIRVAPDAGVGVKVIARLAELERLEGRWGRAGSLTSDFIWMRHCAEVFCQPGELCVVVLESGDSVIAAGQFRLRRGVLTRLEHLGVGDLYEPTDLVYADEPSLGRLAAAIIGMGLPLTLHRLPADSAAIGALVTAGRGRVLLDLRAASPSPYLELDRGWEDPDGMFNAGRRSDFRRARKRAAGLGEVACELLSPEPSEVESLLDEVLRVESSGWKGRSGTAMALDPRRRQFFTRYALDASRHGLLRLAFLRIDGHPVAVQLAIERDDRYYLLKIGYDEQFASCSPGTLLMLHTLGESARRGVRSVEFLGEPEPWTKFWCNRLRHCVALRLYPLSLRGGAAVAIDAATLLWREMRRSAGEEAP